MNYKILILLSAVFLIGCGGSGGSDDVAGDSSCTNDYVVGIWVLEGDKVVTTMEYRTDYIYSSVSSLILPEGAPPSPPFTTAGTYTMGDKVTASDGIEACEVIRTIGDNTCEYLVYVDGNMLYQSSCDSDEIDFNTEYTRF